MRTDIEKFCFDRYQNDPDYICLHNPSPMDLVETRKWFTEVMGDDFCQHWVDPTIPQMFGGTMINSFKFPFARSKEFEEKIIPHLVKDEEGYYFRKDALSEANAI
jgi:hypothetical protein